MNNINDILINLRKDRGLTQQEVAAALFISNKTISKWENGDAIPDLQTLVDIANFYQVPISYILMKDDSLDTAILNKALKISTISTLVNLSIFVISFLLFVKGIDLIIIGLLNIICVVSSVVSAVLLRKYCFSNVRNIVIFCFYFNLLSIVSFLIILLTCLFL